ncbi:hypothetical protein F4779DRAFT_611479 [Xylariaceae sp. FL0662B]|nr:hypothetical protein F4779DRAFT_611479 [Xylariaceae sp. FL0662B]
MRSGCLQFLTQHCVEARVTPALARLLLWPTNAPESDSLFQPYSVRSRTCILECDVNIHKSNSTYLMDLDVSRAELLTRRFAHALRRTRGALVLAGVDISFRREIRPLQAYDTRSCVLAWNKKWIYVLSYHVKPGAVMEDCSDDLVAALFDEGEHAQRMKKLVFAVAISKYVAKSGRRTIPPVDLLEAGDYVRTPESTGKERIDIIGAKCVKRLELLRGKLNNLK